MSLTYSLLCEAEIPGCVARELEACIRDIPKPRVVRVENGVLPSGQFDFIYSLDRVDRSTYSEARGLVANLARRLKPGGALLVGASDSTEEEMAELTAAIPNGQVAGHLVFRDEPGSGVYLQVYR